MVDAGPCAYGASYVVWEVHEFSRYSDCVSDSVFNKEKSYCPVTANKLNDHDQGSHYNLVND